ncbi:hypothetical protein BC830DRAFT_98982 [Chytriomyces sp. MP71]|nr:hypothetical protein BC830DRAFT_98982 [Chytriomyces sp. MP71]
MGEEVRFLISSVLMFIVGAIEIGRSVLKFFCFFVCFFIAHISAMYYTNISIAFFQLGPLKIWPYSVRLLPTLLVLGAQKVAEDKKNTTSSFISSACQPFLNKR